MSNRKTNGSTILETIDTRHQLGRRGEAAAARYLAGQGLIVLEKRFRRRGGEIDLVCLDTKTRSANGYEGDIVFVEVKTRSGYRFGPPESALSNTKRGRIVKTAEVFLEDRGWTNRYARVDVVAIVFAGAHVESLKHYQNAFGLHETRDLSR